MLFEIGKKLLGNAMLPPPLGTIVNVAAVVCAVAEAFEAKDEEDET